MKVVVGVTSGELAAIISTAAMHPVAYNEVKVSDSTANFTILRPLHAERVSLEKSFLNPKRRGWLLCFLGRYCFSTTVSFIKAAQSPLSYSYNIEI